MTRAETRRGKKEKKAKKPRHVELGHPALDWISEKTDPETLFMFGIAWWFVCMIAACVFAVSDYRNVAIFCACNCFDLIMAGWLLKLYRLWCAPKCNVHGYDSIEDLLIDCKERALEGGTETIIAIDFSSSNLQAGKHCFKGKCLHQLDVPGGNPYEQCITMLGETLCHLDKDNIIPVYGFGDSVTTDTDVFALHATQLGGCEGYQGVLERYREITRTVIMEGPTSLVPAINKAIDTVEENRKHHVLIILTDGDIDDDEETMDAIREASQYPISIIAIGIGDGNFPLLRKYDSVIRGRIFDNFTFVRWADFQNSQEYKIDFTIAALQELPIQMNAIKCNGLLSWRNRRSRSKDE